LVLAFEIVPCRLRLALKTFVVPFVPPAGIFTEIELIEEPPLESMDPVVVAPAIVSAIFSKKEAEVIALVNLVTVTAFCLPRQQHQRQQHRQLYRLLADWP